MSCSASAFGAFSLSLRWSKASLHSRENQLVYLRSWLNRISRFSLIIAPKYLVNEHKTGDVTPEFRQSLVALWHNAHVMPVCAMQVCGLSATIHSVLFVSSCLPRHSLSEG